MSGEAELLDEVTPELVRRVEAALAEETPDAVRALLANLSATGQASILEQISEVVRRRGAGGVRARGAPERLSARSEAPLRT